MESNIIQFPIQPSAIDTAKSMSPGVRRYHQLRDNYYKAMDALCHIPSRLKSEPVIRAYPDMGFVAVEKEIEGQNITLAAFNTVKEAVMGLAENYHAQ